MTNNVDLPKLVESKIRHIRNKKIILDQDLAKLYQVKVKRLIEAVKRNIDRFPEEFMFQLTETEYEILRTQFAASSWGGRRYCPYAFTEHGVAMLASVLHSTVAVKISIHIVKTFIRLRELTAHQTELTRQLAALEEKVGKHDHEIKTIFQAIHELIHEPEKPKRRIGFHAD